MPLLKNINNIANIYDINKIYVNKKDNDRDHGRFAPVSMFFREDQWAAEEMFNIMKETAEYSFRYWLF